MPDRQAGQVIGLDKREGGTGNLDRGARARTDQRPRQRGLAGAQIALQRDDVARPGDSRQLRAQRQGGCLFVQEYGQRAHGRQGVPGALAERNAGQRYGKFRWQAATLAAQRANALLAGRRHAKRHAPVHQAQEFQMAHPNRILVIGAGQAGGQAVISLRQGGFEGRITLVGDEPAPPYQRPPLSKAYMKGELEADRLWIRPLDFYSENRVDLVTGLAATGLDLGSKVIAFERGPSLGWDKLILATGARPRRLAFEGAALPGVFELRTLRDADLIRPHLAAGKRMVVVGAGYIGLEAAAVANQLGLAVTVIEAQPHVLSRVAGPEIGQFFVGLHGAKGVEFRLGAQIEAFEGGAAVTAVRLAGGERIGCDVALVGVGVLPNQEIAAEAGLACANGVRVDAAMRTSHPDVYAIGDVALRPLTHYGREGRLESVHNAIEGGKLAAASILGQPAPAIEAPWFWSDQYDLKLQTAGLWTGADAHVVRGEPGSGRFAVFYLQAGRVIAVDAVNAAPEYIVGKRLVAASATVAPADLADTSVSMKDIGAKALS